MNNYLQATPFLDYLTPTFQQLLATYPLENKSPKQKAIFLYKKVRDGWRYDPYELSFQPKHYRASFIAQKSTGHCIDKAILLTAMLRAQNIPARLQLAKVKNHIATERLEVVFGIDELTPHGMVNLFLDGRWLKVSPAFNKSLCEKYQVDPLDFDGQQDSIFQEYDRQGNQFMEYLEDYGYFEDVPVDFIAHTWQTAYPQVYERFRTETGLFRIF